MKLPMRMWRFRTNWRNKLILQIGIRIPNISGSPGATRIVWRDAKVEDIGSYYYDTGGKIDEQ